MSFKLFLKKILSLRLCITLAIICATMIPLGIVGGMIVDGYKNEQVDNLMSDVLGQANLVSADIASSQFISNQSSSQVVAEIEQLARIYSARIMLLNSDFKVVEDTYVFNEGKTIASTEVLKAFRGITFTKYYEEESYAQIVMPIYDVDNKAKIGVMLITITDLGLDENVSYFQKFYSLVLLIFFCVSVVVGFVVSGLLIRPLSRLNKSIQEITNGSKDEYVEHRSLLEYNDISASVNGLLGRIKILDESRQEFVSNVSHELKTPMTSIKVLADSILMQGDASAEMYREFMRDIVDEIDRENRIINSLLTMVKYDKTDAEMKVETVNVNELIELILKRLRPIAVTKNVELVLESFRPVAAELDEVKFTLAITNLVENAIKYNVENGWVRVSVNADHKYFYVKVADSGIGIPTDSKDHIFERFYRVDKARSRETGGTGLGLAITRSVIQLHRGVIKLYSKENEGTTFTVRIPLNYNQGGGEQ